MIETVIFDMDGLLVDSEPLWGEAMAAVFARMDSYLEPGDYAQTTGLRTSEVVAHWHRHFGWKDKSADQVTEEILQEVTGLIQRRGKLMAGVPYILDFFQEKHFKMGLASSSPMALIETVLHQFGLRAYFDALHSGEHQDYGKPHPSVYLSCAQELGAEPVHCLVFEDSITGLIAAKAARMKVVAVPEARNWADPRYVLADLKLPALAAFTATELAALQP